MVVELADWFPGTIVRSEFEGRFLDAFRTRAATWTEVGLSASRSMGVPAMRPLMGVEVPHATGSLRWLWVLFVAEKNELSIECGWGDEIRFDDWGPVEGNVVVTVPRSTGTPEELADYASSWVLNQSRRELPREP